MNKNLRIGDCAVHEGRNVRITDINETRVLCGIAISIPVKELVTPRLTREFFVKNDFREERTEGGTLAYALGGGSTFVRAEEQGKIFRVTIVNKAYRFEGPVDELNELLHALDDCAVEYHAVCV